MNRINAVTLNYEQLIGLKDSPHIRECISDKADQGKYLVISKIKNDSFQTYQGTWQSLGLLESLGRWMFSWTGLCDSSVSKCFGSSMAAIYSLELPTDPSTSTRRLSPTSDEKLEEKSLSDNQPQGTPLQQASTTQRLKPNAPYRIEPTIQPTKPVTQHVAPPVVQPSVQQQRFRTPTDEELKIQGINAKMEKLGRMKELLKGNISLEACSEIGKTLNDEYELNLPEYNDVPGLVRQRVETGRFSEATVCKIVKDSLSSLIENKIGQLEGALYQLTATRALENIK